MPESLPRGSPWASIEPFQAKPSELSEPFRSPGMPLRVSIDRLPVLAERHPTLALRLSTLVSVAGGVRARAIAATAASLEGAEDDPFLPGSRFEPEPVRTGDGTDLSIVVHHADDREAHGIVGYATLRTRFLSKRELDASVGECTGNSGPDFYFLQLHIDAVFVDRRYRRRFYAYALCAGLVELVRLAALNLLLVEERREIIAAIDFYYEPSGDAGERLLQAMEAELEQLARAFNACGSAVEPLAFTLRGIDVDRGW